MSPGKMAAQTGHAFLDAFEQCRKIDPGRAAEYKSGRHGTKIVLSAKNEEQIRLLCEQATFAGLPCALIIDEHHIMPPHFDGSPIVTALGIGPCTRSEIHHLTKRFQLVK